MNEVLIPFSVIETSQFHSDTAIRLAMGKAGVPMKNKIYPELDTDNYNYETYESREKLGIVVKWKKKLEE